VELLAQRRNMIAQLRFGNPNFGTESAGLSALIEEQQMLVRTTTLMALIVTSVVSCIALADVRLTPPSVLQAVSDLREFPAIVSAAQFEMHTDGVGWYWCH
jgi:hypothetical protein